MTEGISGSWQVSKGWTWAKIQDICKVRGRVGWRGYRKSDLVTKGPLVIGATHLSEKWRIDLTEPVFISKEKYQESPEIMVKTGDIVVAQRGSIGKLAIVDFDLGEATINPCVLLLKDIKVNNKFLLYWLASPACQNQLLRGNTSTTTPMITQEFLKNVNISIAPVAEQNRIVSKIEELFTNLDAGVESLKKVKAQLKRYRQAVLKAAMDGKLTQVERKEFVYREELRNDVPAEWDLKTAKELFYIKGRIGWRGLKKSHFTSEGPYLITGIDFIDGKINWENCYHIPMDKYLESPEIFVRKDDILVTKDGTIGKVAYIDHVPGGQTSINAHILLIRNLENNNILPRFTYYMLQAHHFLNFVELKKIGTTRPALTQRAFEEFPFSYPPPEEQEKIVEEIEKRFSFIDEAEEAVEMSFKHSERLRQSILKRAFEGKLVPQDPTDEPAEELLKRIKNEKASRDSGVKPKKKNNMKEIGLMRYVK